MPQNYKEHDHFSYNIKYVYKINDIVILGIHVVNCNQ